MHNPGTRHHLPHPPAEEGYLIAPRLTLTNAVFLARLLAYGKLRERSGAGTAGLAQRASDERIFSSTKDPRMLLKTKVALERSWNLYENKALVGCALEFI